MPGKDVWYTIRLQRFQTTAFYEVLEEDYNIVIVNDENATEAVQSMDYEFIVLVDSKYGWEAISQPVIDAFHSGKPIIAINTEIFGVKFSFAYGFYPNGTKIVVSADHLVVKGLPNIIYEFCNLSAPLGVLFDSLGQNMTIIASYMVPYETRIEYDPLMIAYQPLPNRKALLIYHEYFNRRTDNPLYDRLLMERLVYNTISWFQGTESG